MFIQCSVLHGFRIFQYIDTISVRQMGGRGNISNIVNIINFVEVI